MRINRKWNVSIVPLLISFHISICILLAFSKHIVLNIDEQMRNLKARIITCRPMLCIIMLPRLLFRVV